jgi:hypothetical protein
VWLIGLSLYLVKETPYQAFLNHIEALILVSQRKTDLDLFWIIQELSGEIWKKDAISL